MFILYNLLFFIGFILYFPFLWLKGKVHGDFLTRFGWWPAALSADLQAKENIWIHAVSVGEILAVQGFIAQLKERYPRHRIVLSTVTTTGYQLAGSKFKDIKIIFTPLDFNFAAEQYVRRIRPKIYINAETEIWPNLFRALQRAGVPIVVVNGRISDKSLGGYRAIKFFIKKILSWVNIFCMQNQEAADRIIELGALPAKVRVIGNMKFDDVLQPKILAPQDLGLPGGAWLWVAGSTHPGEEEIVLDVLRSLSREFQQLRLVIAPRHVERTDDVLNVVRQKGFSPLKFSQLTQAPWEPNRVLVVDTIGQLRSLYGLAEVVFVGKSLTAQGGQNIIEPAFFGKPVIVGPNMQNFQDITELFKKAGAILQVKDAENLKYELERLLNDPGRRKLMGTAAREVVQKSQGATARTMNVVGEILKV